MLNNTLFVVLILSLKLISLISTTLIKTSDSFTSSKVALNASINCVGIFEYDNLKSFNYKKISDIFKINTFSLISINQAILKNKKLKQIIKVISIGSSSAIDGFKDTFTYCGSKHALLGIIKSLNETITKKKIFNYCLNLGSIKNKMGKKVRGGEFRKFIQSESVVKSLQFLIDIELPAFPEEIFLKRYKD